MAAFYASLGANLDIAFGEFSEIVEMGEFLACGLGGQALAVLPDKGEAKVGEMTVEQGEVGGRFHGGLVF